MLLRGEPLDTIIKDDQTKKDLMVQNCKEMVKACRGISKKYWPDIDHFVQVSKFALKLFDCLINWHHLGMRERCWLECAAVLHDIGLSKCRGSHHKTSATLILNDTQLPFTSLERRIIANIARYHRKALPKPSHYNLSTLDRETLHKVEILASILRLADSLDYTHQSVAEVLNVKMGTKRITIEYVSKTKAILEEQTFNKKKDLFEKVFAKHVVLIWKRPSKKLGT
jgi:exopolyphosphatase/guanosine-5'-triphosphate,3'-diphosphate pyrophosphatase